MVSTIVPANPSCTRVDCRPSAVAGAQLFDSSQVVSPMANSTPGRIARSTSTRLVWLNDTQPDVGFEPPLGVEAEPVQEDRRRVRNLAGRVAADVGFHVGADERGVLVGAGDRRQVLVVGPGQLAGVR